MSSSTTADEDFTDFVDSSQRDLRRTAYLLCGDWERADDAVQAGLIKVYLRWSKLDRTDSIWSYARRAVVTAVIDDGRRAWHRREATVGELPEGELHDGGYVAVEDRMLLREALDALPRRQRAIVVLRFVDDLDVRDTAFVLTCPEGTVTGLCVRALSFLRTFLTTRGYARGRTPHE